jgi:hypothetical protein
MPCTRRKSTRCSSRMHKIRGRLRQESAANSAHLPVPLRPLRHRRREDAADAGNRPPHARTQVPEVWARYVACVRSGERWVPRRWPEPALIDAGPRTSQRARSRRACPRARDLRAARRPAERKQADRRPRAPARRRPRPEPDAKPGNAGSRGYGKASQSDVDKQSGSYATPTGGERCGPKGRREACAC